MEITITGCRYTPNWETLQQVIREVTHDESCVLTRIARQDNRCDYRRPGVYDLTVRREFEEMPVVLTVS